MRLVDENGKQAGVVALRDAIEAARDVGLDLIEVAPDADPPVCRIMDWGRYRFEQKQREREQRKKQRTAEVKALRLRPSTDEHDFGVTRRKAEAFITDGHKVRVEVRFRGREITHRELGQEILLKLAGAVGEVADIEQQPSMDGRKMYLMLAPKPAVLRAAQAAEKAREERRAAAEAAGEELPPEPVDELEDLDEDDDDEDIDEDDGEAEPDDEGDAEPDDDD